MWLINTASEGNTEAHETIWLGKTKEEMRTLQLEEDKWKEMIEYLEGGRIPRKRFLHCTLNQFSLWDDSVTIYCTIL